MLSQDSAHHPHLSRKGTRVHRVAVPPAGPTSRNHQHVLYANARLQRTQWLPTQAEMNNAVSSTKHQRARLSISQKAEIQRRLTHGTQHAYLKNEFNCSRKTILATQRVICVSQRGPSSTSTTSRPSSVGGRRWSPNIL